MSTAVCELHFLPSIAYWMQLKNFQRLELEACETFQKQSLRNRCYILLPNKTECLTIPIDHSTKKSLIKEVKIDYKNSWVNHFIHSIRTAYGKSPFFEHYFPFIEMELQKKPVFLWDLNIEMLRHTNRFLGKNIDLSETKEFLKHSASNKTDLRNTLIKNRTPANLAFNPYYQNFGNNFVSNLSCLDLLFNMGPESFEFI